MRPRTKDRALGRAAIAAVIALAAGCGGSSSSSGTATPSGRSGPAKTPEVTVPSSAAGAAAVNANAAFRMGLTLAYEYGSTGCEIRTVAASPVTYEFDEWYPHGGGGGEATRLTILDGVASPQPGVFKSDTWRPPGAANCTIHPSGTISVP